MKHFIFILSGLGFAVSMAFAFSGGPPDNVCGAPPTFTNCTQCHSSFPLNSGDGILTVNLGTSEYVPDEIYSGTVNLSDPDQSRWGFELAVLTNSNEQVGTLMLADAVHTQLSDNPTTNPDFLKHTNSGTFAGNQNATWEFQWIAPASGTGTATFYVAGNCANNNGNNQGDYIYTVDLAVAEETSSLCPWQVSVPVEHNVFTNYPNPFNPRTVLSFSLAHPGFIQLDVFNSVGRQVGEIYDGYLERGSYQMPFDGSSLAAGIYYARLRLPDGQMITTLNLVK